MTRAAAGLFWSSVVLTGNSTYMQGHSRDCQFWSSVVLTGNSTEYGAHWAKEEFWSSVVLTGNSTAAQSCSYLLSFGAVSF